MSSRYGKAFSEKSPKEISHGSDFMRKFELIKRGFNGEGKEHKLHLLMDHDDTPTYEKGLQEITLTRYSTVPSAGRLPRPQVSPY
jgi:hypothetical protein